MKQLNIPQLAELDTTYRKVIIQNLWTDPSQLWEDIFQQLSDLPGVVLTNIETILSYGYQNPNSIPTIRYELEEYSNDLDPDFCERFLENNKWKIVRILDIWAGPWDVTMRGYNKLCDAWVIPQIFALESSSRFRKNILDASRKAGISSDILSSIPSENISPGIFPVDWNIQRLGWQDLKDIDLVTGNYVLDRVPQKSLVDTLLSSGVGNIQFTNCVPLQYQNPNTGQSYIPDSEIIIPEWAESLRAIGLALNLEEKSEFFWKNIVTSLQDGQENFDYGAIRGRL